MKKVQNEISKQFAEIWEEHHNHDTTIKKKIERNREQRKKDIKENLGL